MQEISRNLIFIDFNEGTKTMTERVHRVFRPWDGLDDHRYEKILVLHIKTSSGSFNSQHGTL